MTFLGYADDESTLEERELRIPVFMVLLVLLAYTAIGGFLFKEWEDLQYFEAFYFCFITMATVGWWTVFDIFSIPSTPENKEVILAGFGDIVPTEQVYMFFTMIYIIFGLSLY